MIRRTVVAEACVITVCILGLALQSATQEKKEPADPIAGLWSFTEGDEDDGSAVCLIRKQKGGDGYHVQLTRPGGNTINGVGQLHDSTLHVATQLGDMTVLGRFTLSADEQTLSGSWLTSTGDRLGKVLRRLGSWPKVKPAQGV